MRKGANLVIAAGFLIAPTRWQTMAKKFPDTNFAITDYSVHAAPFADKKGNVLFKNVEGITYAANEAGCLVGVLAAKMAQKMGKQHHRCRRRPEDPAGRHLDRRATSYCAKKAVPGTKVIVQLLERLRRDGQVPDRRPEPDRAGRDRCCSRSRAAAASGRSRRPTKPGLWGIGVDVDQYATRKRVLTSAHEARRHRRRTTGGRRRRRPASSQGGTDLVFNLKNNGVGVGKINPAVPKSWITLMN